MEGHVNTYGGINQDAAYDSIKPNMYIDAKDIRISTDTGESQGAFTNMKGNTLSFVIPIRNNLVPSGKSFGVWNTSSPEVIGYTTIRNSIILFVADNSNTKGWIYEVQYNLATRKVDTAVYPKLIYYNEFLYFKKEWPIEALGRYENAGIQRVYWTDYNNILRTINIIEEDLDNFPVGNIDIFPDIQFTQPILQNVQAAGELQSGMYQIAYRLITSDGKETLISPPSNMIHIVKSSELGELQKYVGEPAKINASKAISIQVDTSQYATDFEKIEFFALYYASDTATPVASSIEKLDLIGNTANLLYNGTEDSIFDIELFTFTSKNFAFKTFKTITEKDNYLIGANIKSSTITLSELLPAGQTFDSKTKRYNTSTLPPFTPAGGTNSGGGGLTGDNDLDNAFNLEFNKDKHWDTTWQTDAKQYKYQSDGARLGGEGPNISYTFHLEPKTTDVAAGAASIHNLGGNIQYGVDQHNLQDGYGVRPNPQNSLVNAASPIVSSLLRGYKRGETYRFGIIFYTLKGEATYVEYVGDIKFPDISESDSTNNLSKSPYFPISDSPQPSSIIDPNHAVYSDITFSFDLGIKFAVDFSTCSDLLKNITGFQIVRTPRTSTDKRRLAQGVMSPLAHMGLGGPNSTNLENTDFKIENSENTMNHFNVPYLTLYNGSNSPTFETVLGNKLELKRDSLSYFVDEQDINGTTPNSARFPGILNTNVRSQYLSFYSPEISYNYDNVIETANNLGNTPSLLITGAYAAQVISGTAYRDVETGDLGTNPNTVPASGTSNNIATNLGNSCVDVSRNSFKFRRTVPVTFNSIENIKRSTQITNFDMRDSTNVTIETKTANFTESANNPSELPKMNGRDTNGNLRPFSEKLELGRIYIRNYYVYNSKISPQAVIDLAPGVNADIGLSRPSFIDLAGFFGLGTGYVFNRTGGIARAGSNLTMLIDKYENDPLDSTTTYSSGTTSSLRDYFLIAGNTTHTPIANNAHVNVKSPSIYLPWAYSSDPGNEVDSAIPLVDLVIPRGEVYGGTSQNALEANNFIQASPVIKTTFGTDAYNPIVYGGDIFTSMYSCQKGMIEFNTRLQKRGTSSIPRDYRHPFSRTDLMVTESCINLNLDYGSTRSRGAQFTFQGESTTPLESDYYIQEDTNTQSDNAKLEEGATTYIMYGYNALYSKINKEVAFFIKPGSTANLSLTNDVRAFLSAIKVNGENTDSWTKFGINDYYDVDDHGPINKILNFKDDVYFIQDEGIGNYSINREAVTTTDDGVPTELGTAKGWGKHRYLSKEIGSIHQWAVRATNTAIYFFDAIHRKIYMLGQGKAGLQTSSLSELKGIHSFLQELGDGVFARKESGGDNPILLKGAHIGSDEINDEVIFTFLTSNFYGPVQTLAVLTTYAINTLVDVSGIVRLMTSEVTTSNTIEGARSEVTAASTVIALNRIEDTSIVYDELVSQFSTKLSINPKIWINNGDTLMTSDHDPTVSVTTNIYTHNIGNWGEFYGTQEPCEITLVINPKADINKVLRFLEFNSIVRDDNKVIDRTKTITGFKITTETQSSDVIYQTKPESLTRLKKRFDKWRIKLPRDNNSTSKKGRFRSTHFLLTLYFDNTYNKELIMNRLISYYDPQIF